MYKKMFELINDEINFLISDKLDLKKIEIKGNKVKFVFLMSNLLTVKVVNYELDLLGTEPILKFKNEYIKPYKDKYFR